MNCAFKLPDGTVWPHPDFDGDFSERDCAHAYRVLLGHPWGTGVSVQKMRWLRAALKQARKSKEGER